jgi:L-ascorbate metabolism protein UlaG (beta-lactamase superfamily)
MGTSIQIFIGATVYAFSLSAQRPQADTIKKEKDIVVVQPVFHGALVLTINDKTIYVDPYGGATRYEGLKKPDLILITDIHPDHLDTSTLRAISFRNAQLIVPSAVSKMLSDQYKKNQTILDNGKDITKDNLKIIAIPMYNLPEMPDSKHPKGRGNGYLIEAKNTRVYISGDTEDIPEMRQLKNIDIAFVCMNLPYTMDVNQAADAVNEFKPKIVYPYHYRGKEGLSDVNEFKRLVERAGRETEVRLRDWYAK